MRPTPILALPLLLPAACGPAGEHGAANVAGLSDLGRSTPASTRAAGPREAAAAFLDAVASGDEARVEEHLTRRAREVVASEEGFSFHPPEDSAFELGQASVEGGEASVPASVEVDGQPQSFDVLLREEEAEWRVHGVAMPFAETTWTISFEGEVDEENPLVQGITEGLAEGLAEEMGNAFEEAMSDWAAGGSGEEIALERARYHAIAAVSPEAFEEAWRVDRDAGGRAGSEVLEALLAGTGYGLDQGAFAEPLARPLDLPLAGMSRVQAIEAVAAALDLSPVWEDATNGWGDLVPTLSFAAGARSASPAFVGPFSVEAEVEEHAPRTTGDLTLTVRGLGLPEEVLAANSEMGEVLAPGPVRAPTGADLSTVEPGTSFWGTPVIRGSSFVYTLNLELRGLVSSVDSLSAEGELFLVLPRDVTEVAFDAVGTAQADRWDVACEELGTHSRFTVTGTGALDDLHVAFAPDGAAGPLGILSSGSMAWSGKLTADLDTPEPPTRVALKIQGTEELALSWRVEGVPLVHHAAQPERVEPLSFTGAEPLAVAFVSFADVSNPEFPEVRLRIASSANKPAMDAMATFEYLDAAGAVAHEFPHNLSGEFTFEGAEPLCEPGQELEQDVTAFFMPEGTRSVRVRLESVTFLDGTTWSRE